MAFSTIRYTEPKQSTYRSIDLKYQENGQEKTKSFDSGNIIIDYYDYMLFLQELPDSWYKENYHIIGSSTWDHFFMDGNKYTESYFDPATGEFMDWRKAWDEKNFELYRDIVDNGKYPRVIHLTCHKNFLAVKKYYKAKTKNRVVVSAENA
jgi:hypothetical protein